MIVRATNTKNNNLVIFTWNEDLTTCDYTAIGVPHEEVEELMDIMLLAGVHEGNDYKEWRTKIY